MHQKDTENDDVLDYFLNGLAVILVLTVLWFNIRFIQHEFLNNPIPEEHNIMFVPIFFSLLITGIVLTTVFGYVLTLANERASDWMDR